MLNGVSIMVPQLYGDVYDADAQRRLHEMLHLPDGAFAASDADHYADALREAHVLVTGWGAPTLDDAFLDRAPNLRLVLYGAGSIRSTATEDLWRRGVQITSAWHANAVPVAEYTTSVILLSLKRFFRLARRVREERRYPKRERVPGAFGSTVGLVSLGAIGRLVAERLRSFDLDVIAYDPFATPEEAMLLGVRLVSLEEVFARADVVSLHTPWLPETEGMIRAGHFESMRPGATFLNTARGAVVNEPEMLEVLARRPDLEAVLDVVYPEPPAPESALFDLPNVTLTPHIAGALDGECARLGRLMVEELERYVAGQPLRYGIDRATAAILA